MGRKSDSLSLAKDLSLFRRVHAAVAEIMLALFLPTQGGGLKGPTQGHPAQGFERPGRSRIGTTRSRPGRAAPSTPVLHLGGPRRIQDGRPLTPFPKTPPPGRNERREAELCYAAMALLKPPHSQMVATTKLDSAHAVPSVAFVVRGMLSE